MPGKGKGTKKEAAEASAAAAEAASAAAEAASAASEAASAASEASAAASEASAAAEAAGGAGGAEGAGSAAVAALRLGVANYVKPSERTLLQGFGGFGPNFRVPPLQPLASLPLPSPVRLRSASPTRLGSQITRYLNLGDTAEGNTAILSDILKELLYMNLGIQIDVLYNKVVLDFDVVHPSYIHSNSGSESKEDMEGVDSRLGKPQNIFSEVKGNKQLTGLIFVKPTGSIAFIKHGAKWYTANPKVGVLQLHVKGMPGWQTVPEAEYAVCLYTLLVTRNPQKVEGTSIFSSKNHTDRLPAAALGGGAGSAAAAAAATTGDAVTAELAAPLVETSHIDSLCNVLCFADGFRECFVTKTTQQICSNSTDIPIFFKTFEDLLGYQGQEGGAYFSYLKNAVINYDKKLFALQEGHRQLEKEKQSLMAMSAEIEKQMLPSKGVVAKYMEVLKGQRLTTQAEINEQERANQHIVQSQAKIQKIQGHFVAAQQKLTQVDSELMAHLQTKSGLDIKLHSIQDLQLKMQNRIDKIRRALLYQEFAAEDAKRVLVRNPLDPLGGLTLESEQVKECRALKFLSAMYIRYCHFGSKPLKQLTSAQRVNSSWGAFNTRVALKGSKKRSRYRITKSGRRVLITGKNPNPQTRNANALKRRENATRKKRKARKGLAHLENSMTK